MITWRIDLTRHRYAKMHHARPSRTDHRGCPKLIAYDVLIALVKHRDAIKMMSEFLALLEGRRRDGEGLITITSDEAEAWVSAWRVEKEKAA